MPRINALKQRWVQTCRRELLDRTLIWNQRRLLYALRKFEHPDQAREVIVRPACRVRADWMSGALTTTSAGAGPPGNAAMMWL
jgi:hypothetical protein